MKKKWSAGKIIGIVCGSIAAAILLMVTLYISVFQLTRDILTAQGRENSYRQTDRGSYDEQEDPEEDRRAGQEDNGGSRSRREREERAYEQDPYENKVPEYDSNDFEYYEFHDALREDLSYQAEFETFEKTFGENENILFRIIYPVFYSKQDVDLTGVNNAVQKELNLLRDYAESVTEWVDDDEQFVFEADSYVTYMDEEVLSIAYVEHGYLDGSYHESYVVSVNIDMDSRMMLTNSKLLNIDDEFSIEFRNRCEKQNGEISSLYYYTDQDITEMLNSDEELILFYTPIGMEVGFNYYNGWVTVTYPDYQKYQKRF